MRIPDDSISAIIIARNEDVTIEKVLLETIKILPRFAGKYEILVNDDASTDKTAHILNKLSIKYPFIKVYHQKTPLGITGGLEFLYKKAKYNLITANSGDGQCTINDLPQMIQKINEGYDIVIGKRKHKSQYKLTRKIISFGFNFLPKILFGVNLYDAGSMKLYRKAALLKTQPRSKSFFSEPERIIRGYKMGLKITFVNIRHFKRKKGESSTIRIGLIVSSLLDMIKLRFLL